MDICEIKGSILSAMADAVENASVVIIAMTEKYKNSNATRTGAPMHLFIHFFEAVFKFSSCLEGYS